MSEAIDSAEVEKAYQLFDDIRNLRKKHASEVPFPGGSQSFEAEMASQVQDVMSRASEAAAVTTDPLARRAVQLLVKRDLVSIGTDAIAEFLRSTKFREAATALQSIHDSYHNISDEWRVLLEDQEASWRGDLAVLQDELRSVESETGRQEERIRKLEAEKEALRVEKDRLMKLVEALQEEKESLAEEFKAATLSKSGGVSGAGAGSSGLNRSSSARGRTPASPARGRTGDSPLTPGSAKRTRGTPPGAASPGRASVEEAALLNKMLTLRQLKDAIKEVYESKAKSDAAARQGAKPRETMEEHMYALYNTKLGVRSVILIHIERILKAIDKYAAEDFEVALFGKILANELEEEFYYELQHLEREVKDQLRALLRTRYMHQSRPPKEPPREFIQAQLDLRVKGEIPEEEAMTLLANLQDTKERDLVVRRLEDFQKGREREKPRFNYSDPVEMERPPTLRYEDFTRLMAQAHMEVHEEAVRGVVEAFKEVDKDRAGFLTPEQFATFCRRISVGGEHEVSEEEIARLADVLDTWKTRRITFSTCVYELAGDLVAMSNGQ